MARRNLSSRPSIPDEVLRQRRDLYALSIGLLLFYVAGGSLQPSASISSLAPISLDRPEYLLVAAWIGLIYFWVRLWLVSEARPFRDYLEDVRWQAGDTQMMRRIASKHVKPYVNATLEQQQQNILRWNGPVPMPKFAGLSPEVWLEAIYSAQPKQGSPAMPAFYGDASTKVSGAELLPYLAAWIVGAARATYRERTFSDYTLPNLFALATFVVGAVCGDWLGLRSFP